ncbi:MAG: malto-oligosyltrehalose synthase [bacterium]
MPAPLSEMLREIAAQVRIPCATYRLQFGRDFTFREARALVPYLHDLGITDLYASPVFKLCSADSHAYDICDHNELDPAIGGEEAFDDLSEALQACDMGFILDVVPNHMGIRGAGNAWWFDVLENGPSSPYASFFDIDWRPVKPELENKVLLPILEDQYGRVLETGKFRLAFEGGAFLIYYYENKFPVAPRTYALILGRALELLAERLEKESEHLQELQSILTALSYLPLRTEVDPEKIEERQREKEVIKRRIANLCGQSPETLSAIEQSVAFFNGNPQDWRSFDGLDELFQRQGYRPAFWRVASDEINYRRFFDINNLAAIRMELPAVFAQTHRLIFRLVAEGKVTGLRVDHPDGLWNPSEYFRKLQREYLIRRLQQRVRSAAAPEEEPSPAAQIEPAAEEWIADADGGRRGGPSPGWPLYIVAEKILSESEPLPGDWAVHGTTGYDFLNDLNGIFVETANRALLNRVYTQFIGRAISYPNLLNSSKKMIMLISLASEIHSLSHQLERISEGNRWYRDFTLNSLMFAIREIIACLAVYRTYIHGSAVQPRDASYIEAATEEAKRRNPRTAEAIFDFIRDTLLLRNLADFPERDKDKLLRFVMKFQQTTGPVMAKGCEDTAFYVFNRLASLNEVGGDPERFGTPIRAFHEANARRLADWPHTLLATSTHDTKRSEDVRARINVLSEIPAEWRSALGRWSRLNASKKTVVDGEAAPDSNDEYLLYQALVGARPAGPLSGAELAAFRERVAAYMQKAISEAKVHTSWINPNEEYEKATLDFVHRVLDGKRKNRFLRRLEAFANRVAFFGCFNALSQVLLKLTAPGVPDLYQGTETWNLSLVDPDNRRPVDYEARRRMLDELKDRVDRSGAELLPLAGELLESLHDGRSKLYLTFRTLNFRRDHRRLFTHGDYLPLEGRGERQDHVCAFARVLDRDSALVVAPCRIAGLTGGVERPPMGEEVWKDTRLLLPPDLEGRSYRNFLTGEPVRKGPAEDGPGLRIALLLGRFPVALLEQTGGET